MQKRGAEQEGQHPCESLINREIEQTKKPEADQASEHADEDVRGVADNDVAYRGIGALVIRKDRQPVDVGPQHVGRQHQNRLAESVPSVEFSAPSVDAEIRIFSWAKYRRLRCPKRVGGLQAVSGIARAQLPGLHDRSCE